MTNTDQISDLFRDLVTSLISRPRDLSLRSETIDGVVYWTMKAHGDDHGKLVGKHGAHAKALAVLMIALGRAQGQNFVFNLLEPDHETRPNSTQKQFAQNYDATAARHLLTRILENLDIGSFIVETEQLASAYPLLFLFRITVESDADVRALQIPLPQLPDYLEMISTLDALVTLFRARANKDGVHFKLTVERKS